MTPRTKPRPPQPKTVRLLTKEFVKSLEATGETQIWRDSRCVGLQLRVGRSGKKVWYYDYRDPTGKRQTYRIDKGNRLLDPGEARKVVEALSRDPAAEQRATRHEAKLAVTRTLRAFLEGRYWSDYLQHRKSGEATRQRLTAAFKNILDVDMVALDPVKLAKHRAQRRAAGVTPQTLNRDRTALLSAINQAVRWRLLERNPIDDPAYPPFGRSDIADDKRVRWLGQRDEHEDIRDPDTGEKLGERQRFLRALVDRKTPEYLRQLVGLAMNTGLRRGELFDLRWADVSLQRRELTVTAATAKSNKTRRVPLNAPALTILKQLGKVRHISGRVFVSSKAPDEADKNATADATRFDNIKRSWASLVERAQLDDFTFHDLRHDYASRLVQAGVDLYVVKELLGHSSIELTQRYAHLKPGALHAAVAQLGGGAA